MTDQRVVANGRGTRYLESGAGRPVILIHAFPLSAEMWRPQLDRVPDGWRFVAPDLRGFEHAARTRGRPPWTTTPTTSGASWMRWIERAVMAGLSMGGYITLPYSAAFRRGSSA
jgi:pimeloyl-ACP methyl ester carboxylesterase